MIKMKNSVVIIILTFLVFSCAHLNHLSISNSPSTIYNIANKKLKSNQFELAVLKLKQLKNLYPFSIYSKQIELDLLYAYYKTANFSKAQLIVKRFIQRYPNDVNIDYCIYINGLIEMNFFNTSFLERTLNINNYNHDMVHFKEAEKMFFKLINYYPKSKYLLNAKNNLNILQEQLAKNELSIALFYNNHGAYVAVINRTKNIIDNYPKTKAVKDAIILMKNAYSKMYMNKLAKSIPNIP